jgi:hypothetical protein
MARLFLYSFLSSVYPIIYNSSLSNYFSCFNFTAKIEASQGRGTTESVTILLLQANRMDPEELEDEELEQIR